MNPSQELPSTAILRPQNRYGRFNRCIRCPLEGMLAGLSLVIGHWSSVRIPYGGRRWLGTTHEGRRHQIRGFRAEGLAGCRLLEPSHPALATYEDARVQPCPPKLIPDRLSKRLCCVSSKS